MCELLQAQPLILKVQLFTSYQLVLEKVSYCFNFMEIQPFSNFLNFLWDCLNSCKLEVLKFSNVLFPRYEVLLLINFLTWQIQMRPYMLITTKHECQLCGHVVITLKYWLFKTKFLQTLFAATKPGFVAAFLTLRGFLGYYLNVGFVAVSCSVWNIDFSQSWLCKVFVTWSNASNPCCIPSWTVPPFLLIFYVLVSCGQRISSGGRTSWASVTSGLTTRTSTWPSCSSSSL